LESVCRRNPTVGSNPTLSAKITSLLINLLVTMPGSAYPPTDNEPCDDVGIKTHRNGLPSHPLLALASSPGMSLTARRSRSFTEKSISFWIRVPYDSVRGARGQNPRGPIIILCDSEYRKSQTQAFYADPSISERTWRGSWLSHGQATRRTQCQTHQ
jgi:hypothetical protein